MKNERNISVLLTLEYYNRYDFKLYLVIDILYMKNKIKSVNIYFF